MKRLLYLLFAFSILSCSKKEEIISPDSIYNVSSVWEKQDGSKISFIDLKGKVIVTTMIFTSCKTACPRLTAEMKKIAKEVGKVDPDNIEYLLISIDPKTDTPEVMKAYLKTHQLDEKEWMFIRSNENDTREIANIMAVKYKEISPIEFSHSNIISVYSKKGTLAYQKEGLDNNIQSTAKEIKKQLEL
ncbi:SCO family protein [Chryseobacterium sp. Ch-15]|uniref:SCO family protein n=1 Tax=Chryseobacterium muglaense TaxID=2893752 RepID=A0A9Q3UTI0_9FLAO|nr:SCO family protein [Chryseobacterium muglaense]MBD3906322.1 SCO family protein [Chryseobacterium muglaense]MCC9033089.1 SCO family protein [Chryseobacterium muglaense]MCM2556020.1 SCO family protein [Chryseobacterium muglaense]